jgi:hypothetical protein
MSNDARSRIECEQCLEWIESALDDHLEATRKESFDEHVAGCESCATAYEDARIVHDLFQRAGRPMCPDHVVDSILAQVDAHIETDAATIETGATTAGTAGDPTDAPERAVHHTTSPAPTGRWLDRAWRIRPAWIGAAAVVVLFFTLWLPGRIQQTGDEGQQVAMSHDAAVKMVADETGMTEAEIEAAADEMKMALALVSRTMVKSTHLLSSEVSGHLSRPLRSNFEPFLREAPAGDPAALPLMEDGQSSLDLPPRGEC